MVVRQVIHTIVKGISSLLGVLAPLFTMSSYISPFGVAPVGNSYLTAVAASSGSPMLANATSLLNSTAVASGISAINSVYSFANPLDRILGEQLATSSVGQIFPFPIAAGSGYVVYMVITKVLGRIESLTYTTPKSYSHASPDVMRSLGPGLQPHSSPMPASLPADMTKTQFLILQSYRQGLRKSQDIEKSLTIDRNEIKREVLALKAGGYMTQGNKLSSKGLEIISGGAVGNLPADITKAQFLLLQASHQGMQKSKEIEQYLSVDKKEIEREMAALKASGYLTKKSKLSSKGLEALTTG